MKAAYEVHDHPIAVPEPEGAILNREARGIAVRRIVYRLLPLPGEPKTGLALLQSRRQGCEIEPRSYRVLRSL